MLNFFHRKNYIAFGDAARDARRWTEAAEYYRRALERQPHNPPIWVQYGHALKEGGRLTEAEAAYRRSLAFAPEVADTYLQLGHVSKLQGKIDQMQEAYLKAFVRDPTSTDAMHELLRLGLSKTELIELRHQLASESDDLLDPVLLRAPKGDGHPSSTANDSSRLKLSVDRPTRLDGHAAHPVRLKLLIEGWAIAHDGVASVSATIDGVSVGSTKTCLRRTDIRDAYPDWPESLMSGFALLVNTKNFMPGEHRLEVVLRTCAGETTSTAFTFTMDSGETWPLRRKITRAEVIVLENILERRGHHRAIGLLIDIVDANQMSALKNTLVSLQSQVYARWSLTMLCRQEDIALLETLLDDFQELANKIHVAAAAQDRDALGILAGHVDFVALLSPGDMLACDSLLQIAVAAAVTENVDFLYGDERRISPVSGQVEPFFKPQWSPDLLLSTNYIGRLWCANLTALAGMTLEDWRIYGEYDLVLRATEVARRIRHVPGILCERGHVTIDDPSQEKVALYRAMERRGIEGRVVDDTLAGYFHIERTIDSEALVTVIIPTAGNVTLLEKCMSGLLERTSHRNLEIIVIHNTSTRKEAFAYFEIIASDPRVRILDSKSSFNFSQICNLGATHARGHYLLFLNDDIEITSPDWIDRMLEHAQRPDIGIVGARLLYPNGTIQHAGIFWVDGQRGGRHAFRHLAPRDPGYFGLAQTTRNVLAVTGACIMLRREWFEEIGCFDERHSIVNNDVDLSLRCWSHGKAVIYEPRATLIHHELASRQDLPDTYDSAVFWTAWGGVTQMGDPYFHPYLARDIDDYVPDPEPSQRRYAGGPLFSRDEIHRILLVKLDHLGDFITAIPAMEKLKAEFPNAEFYLLAPAATGLLAENLLRGFELIIPFEFFHARSGEGGRVISEEEKETLRNLLTVYQFDLAIDLRKHLDTREILLLAGARWLAGYDRDLRFPWLDIALEWEGDTKLTHKRSHVIDDLMRLADAITAAAEVTPQTLTIQGGSAESFGFTGRPLICIHPGVGAPARQWPTTHYAALIDLLANNHDVEILIIGSESEVPIAEDVLGKVVRTDIVRSVVGAVSLADLPALLASAALFVGNNSGPKHIAAGLGIPTVGVHSGAVEVAEWGPVGPNAVTLQRDMVCGPCYIAHVDQCPRGLACLTELSPATVYAACRDMLAGVASM